MGTRALIGTCLALALLGGCGPNPGDDPAAWRPTPQERRALAAACQRDRDIYERRLQALNRVVWSRDVEEQYIEGRRLYEQAVLRCRGLASAAQ